MTGQQRPGDSCVIAALAGNNFLGAGMNGDGRGFGGRLRGLRKSAGLSQEELAERSGLNVRTISNLERGYSRWPYRDTLRRLADALLLSGVVRPSSWLH